MRIASVGRAFPPHHYDQETLIDAFRAHWGQHHHNIERLVGIHRNVLVGGRNLALPIEEYLELKTFGDSNDAWIRIALDVGAEAITTAIAPTGLTLQEIDAIVFVSITGLATPSLDARLVNRLGLSPNIRRMPIFGLGCVAGAAGLSRAADQVRARPKSCAVLLSVELCSLTLQREDFSIPNLISSGLFGDGAAAVVLLGEEHPLADPSAPRIIDSRSVFYPDTERVLGWDISERGFKMVLSAELPKIAGESLPRDVDAFLADHELERKNIERWMFHPGGPNVLEALEEGLDLPPDALELTWNSLREVGNVSSASVLMVLQDTLAASPPPPGSYGLVLAMGPGFCAELVLLQW